MPSNLLFLEYAMSHLSAPSVRHLPVGAWRLHPGHAMSLRPKQHAVLRVYCGRVWATLGQGAEAGAPDDGGDRFLGPGDVLSVPAGASLVMEPVAVPGDQGPVHFDWSDAVAPAASGRFAREVGAPARELWSSLGHAAVALTRMVFGLLGYSEFLVAGRGRVLSPLESLRS
jgi:Protein of unknown function (DUF2917)